MWNSLQSIVGKIGVDAATAKNMSPQSPTFKGLNVGSVDSPLQTPVKNALSAGAKAPIHKFKGDFIARAPSPSLKLLPKAARTEQVGPVSVLLDALPHFECMEWEATLSHEARKCYKSQDWKWMCKDPYVRVFAFDTLRKYGEPRWEVSVQRDLPNYECMEWQAVTLHEPLKCYKSQDWKWMCKDPYVYVFAFDTLREAYEPRWEHQWATVQADLPNYECVEWEATLSHEARKCYKSQDWKWMCKDPYVYVFAFDTLRKWDESRWQQSTV